MKTTKPKRQPKRKLLKSKFFIPIASSLLATSLAICLFFLNKKAENDRFIKELAFNTPRLTCTWDSNYHLYAAQYPNLKVKDKLNLLSSSMKIANNTGDALQDFSLQLYFSFDEDLYIQFRGPVNGYHVCLSPNIAQNTLFPGQCIEINDFLKSISKCLNIPLKIIFPFYEKEYKNYSNNFIKEEVPIKIDNYIYYKFMLVDIAKIDWQALNFRLIINYTLKGYRYTQIAVGRIGIGYTRHDSKMAEGLYISDHFRFLGDTKIGTYNPGYTPKEYQVLTNQVFNNIEKIHGPELKDYLVRCEVKDASGTETMIRMWASEVSSHKYYNARYDKNHEGLCFKGTFYAIEENYEEAIKYLSLAYRERIDDPDLLYNMGICYLKNGRHKEALKIFDEFIRYGKSYENYKLVKEIIKKINKRMD